MPRKDDDWTDDLDGFGDAMFYFFIAFCAFVVAVAIFTLVFGPM